MEMTPQQALMQNSLMVAQAQSGRGASLQNRLTRTLGQLYERCSVCCVLCGCTGNLITIEQGYAGCVTEFGRYSRTLPPGRHLFNIFTEKVISVSMRTVCLDVPAQTLMTKDNLALTIDAVCFYNVFDARLAAFEVEDYQYALGMLAQVTIRSVLGEMNLQEILAGRNTINDSLRKIIDERTDPWGIKVDRVELKEIKITDQMQRAMAAKAEAGQEAEAKLVQARAQREASSILKEAARELNEEPNAMKLHWFETLRLISTQGQNTTIIVPDNIEPSSALAMRNAGK
jgi:uncharacterized membrane protein YqiK